MKYKGDWSKGYKIKRFNGDVVDVIDNGKFIKSEGMSLWYYKIRYIDGSKGCVYPTIRDRVISRRLS